MLKMIIKWGVSGIAGIVIVVLILSVFTWLIRPAKIYLSDYLEGYFTPNFAVLRTIPGTGLPYPPIPNEQDWASNKQEPPLCQFNISGVITEQGGAPIQDAQIKIYNSGIFDEGDFRFTNVEGEFSYTEIGTETCDKEQFYMSVSKNGFEPYYLMAAPDDQIMIALAPLYTVNPDD
jgi:hypothetical protein